MMGLTQRQRECLDFIRAHVKAHGFSPSFDEVAAHLGLKSKSTISRVVDALVANGSLLRVAKGARGLQPAQTVNHHRPDCQCANCANARYIAQLKLIQSLKVEPPIAVLKAKADNFRCRPSQIRAALLGVRPVPAAKNSSAALPRERAR